MVIDKLNYLCVVAAKSSKSWGRTRKEIRISKSHYQTGQESIKIDYCCCRYDDEDIQHMRKVVAYCKRHLAQEEKAKKDPNSKSARSLKNWGHDPQKS